MVLLAGGAAAGVVVVLHRGGESPSSPGPAHLSSPPARVVAHVCDATAYGADPTGRQDSQPGIQAAIDACSKVSNGEVTLPAGTFALLDGKNIAIRGRFGPWVRGDGPAATRLVQHGHANIFQIRTSGTMISDLNLDTASFNPGDPTQPHVPSPGALYANADRVVVVNVQLETGTGFGMRLVGPQPCYADARGGSFVSDVTVVNRGTGGYAAIDIDCQNGATVRNVQIHGGILAIYRDTNVTVDGEVYTPSATAQRCAPPWFITGPASNITVTNVISHGGRGVVHQQTSQLAISKQQVLTGGC